MKKVVPVNATLIPEKAERVFKGTIFDVYHWQQEMFDGSYETFEMLRRPDSVNIIGIHDNKLVVVREQQPGTEPWFGIPAGRHDVEGETELEAAKREMKEETGLSFKNWRLLSVDQPSGKLEWFDYTFLATTLTSEEKQSLDVGEKIEVHYMSLEEIKEKHQKESVRFWPEELSVVSELDELLALPEFKGKEIER